MNDGCFDLKLSKHNSTNKFVLTKTAFNSIPKMCSLIPQPYNNQFMLSEKQLVGFRTGLIQSGAALQGSTDWCAAFRSKIKIPSPTTSFLIP